MKIEKSWQLSNNLDEYKSFNREFNLFLEEHRVESNGNYALNVAAEELISNIIKFNPGLDNVVITVELIITDNELEICISDNAGAFDISSVEKTDLTRDLAEIDVGGLGIDLVKNLFHSCQYNYVSNKNTVRLIYLCNENCDSIQGD